MAALYARLADLAGPEIRDSLLKLFPSFFFEENFKGLMQKLEEREMVLNESIQNKKTTLLQTLNEDKSQLLKRHQDECNNLRQVLTWKLILKTVCFYPLWKK